MGEDLPSLLGQKRLLREFLPLQLCHRALLFLDLLLALRVSLLLLPDPFFRLSHIAWDRLPSESRRIDPHVKALQTCCLRKVDLLLRQDEVMI